MRRVHTCRHYSCWQVFSLHFEQVCVRHVLACFSDFPVCVRRISVCLCVCVKQVWRGMQDWRNLVSVHFRYCHGVKSL